MVRSHIPLVIKSFGHHTLTYDGKLLVHLDTASCQLHLFHLSCNHWNQQHYTICQLGFLRIHSVVSHPEFPPEVTKCTKYCGAIPW